MSRVLYSYWRSSAAYRVRIALHLKDLPFTTAAVHLVRNGGEQHQQAYRDRNPQGLVPWLVDGEVELGQSLAIIEYLDEEYPWPALLPLEPAQRAHVRALALLVSCDIHPLNNLRVLRYLTDTAQLDKAARDAWYAHWIAEGFAAFESLVQRHYDGAYCCGDTPTLADLCLVPQVYNAERFECDMAPYPTIRAITERCRALPAFAQAAPEAQPDAVT